MPRKIPPLYNSMEVERYTGIREEEIYRLVDNGWIRPYQKTRNPDRWRFTFDVLFRFYVIKMLQRFGVKPVWYSDALRKIDYWEEHPDNKRVEIPLRRRGREYGALVLFPGEVYRMLTDNVLRIRK